MRRSLFNADHDAFRGTVRQFLAQNVVPEYPEWEKSGRPSESFWKAAGQAGILGIGVPTEYGGNEGTTFTHSVVVTEEIQRLGLAIGGLRIHTDIAMPYLLDYATPEQKRHWLPRLVAGDAVIALAISEPGAGSDIKSMSTRAVRDGDHFVVNGSKTFISNGAAADLLVLACKTDPSAGRDGLSILLVDTTTPGFTRGRSLNKLGLKAQDLAELSFENMVVPAENLLGREGDGFAMLTANLAQERLSIAVNSQAAATAVLDATTASSNASQVRQSHKFALADCATEIQAGAALVDSAVLALGRRELSPSDAAMVKLYCTELQGRVTDRCMRVIGSDGFRAGEFAGRAYLDGRVSRIYGGSSEIMKVIIAQSLNWSQDQVRV
ncbi:acyl-CoA dehydrogenase family protein [Rhodococcus olei]|uniref:Acyl-CoA dehydrogenase family protein n=1 Tax=Rhodococcus olei TaxID=2161675 RepID=A0ABP8PRR3_9NOCA